MAASVPILPLPNLQIDVPALESPHVVEVLDRIRFKVADAHPDGSMDEFAWFAREYPRAYRHHLECADFRLKTILDLYVELHRELVARLGNTREGVLELSQSDLRVKRIYWDFESFLSEVGIALDTLVRIAGVGFKDEMPPNFNKFCRKGPPTDHLCAMLLRAQDVWVNRMKDYRDCFVHYTPVDTQLSIRLVRRKSGYETRCKLPINPNERDITRFRFPLSVELLRYAISVRRQMRILDSSVARWIESGYKAGTYPRRTVSLLRVGRRERS